MRKLYGITPILFKTFMNSTVVFIFTLKHDRIKQVATYILYLVWRDPLTQLQYVPPSMYFLTTRRSRPFTRRNSLPLFNLEPGDLLTF